MADGKGAKRGYHHGNLRAALLRAGEEELAENGVTGFSLRGCARRAGVSHAAPAHHFGSVEGLFAELASLGFERLGERMAERMSGRQDPEARLIASGRGYVDFALSNPALFRLMFSAARPAGDPPSPDTPAARAFTTLQANVAALRKASAEETALDAAAAWSGVHGLAHLLIEGVPLFPAGMAEDERNAVIDAIIERTAPRIRDR